MSKEIKEFVDVLSIGSEDGWNVFSLSEVKAPTSFNIMAIDRASKYADENNLLIFTNISGVKKTNQELNDEGADFDFNNEDLLNEFKDEVYDEIANAIIELGGKVVYSSPNREEFEEMCIKAGISEEEIAKFDNIERFHLVYKF